MLRTNRSFWKYFLLSIITLGIYGLVVDVHLSEEINTVASKRDGKKTINYLWVFFILGPITLGIYTLVWYHQFSKRVGEELAARKIPQEFGAKTFWLWNILGSLVLIGPFIYIARLLKAFNAINDDYNKTHFAAAPAAAAPVVEAPKE